MIAFQRRNNSGFTLIELMMVIAIASLLLAMGVPSFQSLIRNSRLTNATNAVIGDIHLARSEALKRNAPINICRAAAPTSKACGGGAAGRYDAGWLVYEVEPVAGSRPSRDQPFAEAAGDTLLRVSEKQPVGVTVYSDTDNGYLSFAPDGTFNEVKSTGGRREGTIVVCYEGTSTDSVPGRMIVVAPTGRPSVCYDPAHVGIGKTACPANVAFSCG